jgi:hypothetical protein
VRSSASGLAIGVAYPRRHRPERIRSASSRSRTRSTGIIHEGRGLARTVRRISRSGGVSSGGSRQLLRCWRRLKMVERRDDPQWNGRPAWDDYETVIVLASEEAHRALLGTTNPATLFAQLSFGPSRGFPGTTVLIAASSACQTAPHAQSLTNPMPLPTIAFRAGAEARNQRIGLARPAPRWRSHCHVRDSRPVLAHDRLVERFASSARGRLRASLRPDPARGRAPGLNDSLLVPRIRGRLAGTDTGPETSGFR